MYFPEETLRAYIADGKVRLVPELADCAGAKAAEMNGFEAAPHNCVCGLRPIFCPIRAVIKGGNIYSIQTVKKPR